MAEPEAREGYPDGYPVPGFPGAILPRCQEHATRCKCAGHAALKEEADRIKAQEGPERFAEYQKARKKAMRVWAKRLAAEARQGPAGEAQEATPSPGGIEGATRAAEAAQGLVEAARAKVETGAAEASCSRCGEGLADLSMETMGAHQETCDGDPWAMAKCRMLSSLPPVRYNPMRPEAGLTAFRCDACRKEWRQGERDKALKHRCRPVPGDVGTNQAEKAPSSPQEAERGEGEVLASKPSAPAAAPPPDAPGPDATMEELGADQTTAPCGWCGHDHEGGPENCLDAEVAAGDITPEQAQHLKDTTPPETCGPAEEPPPLPPGHPDYAEMPPALSGGNPWATEHGKRMAEPGYPLGDAIQEARKRPMAENAQLAESLVGGPLVGAARQVVAEQGRALEAGDYQAAGLPRDLIGKTFNHGPEDDAAVSAEVVQLEAEQAAREAVEAEKKSAAAQEVLERQLAVLHENKAAQEKELAELRSIVMARDAALKATEKELAYRKATSPRPTRVDEDGKPLPITKALKRDLEAFLYHTRPESAPPAFPRASSMGKGCIRRLAWEMLGSPRGALELRTRGVFSRGDVWEEETGRRLRFMGWTVERTQEAHEYRDPEDARSILWRGHWDGVLRHPDFPGLAVPWDAKSCADRVWRKIPEAPGDPTVLEAAEGEDGVWRPMRQLLSHEYVHLRGYVHQMNAYLWAAEAGSYPFGVLVFVNADTGLPKVVPVKRDPEIRDQLVEDARAAIQWRDACRVQESTLEPWEREESLKPPMAASLDACRLCPFNGTSCWPGVEIDAQELVTGPVDLIQATGDWVKNKQAAGVAKRAQELVRPRYAAMPDGVYHVPGVARVTVSTRKDGVRVVNGTPVEKKENSHDVES